jgi:hypothetical protein
MVTARESSSKGEFFQAWSYMGGFTCPFFSWYASCDWRRVWFLVFPFPLYGPYFLGCLFAWTFGLCPLVSFSLPFLGAFFL